MSQYSSQLRDSRWQKKRLELLGAAHWECEDCGDVTNKELHVHHKYYLRGKAPWDYPDDAFSVLCESCHTQAKKSHDKFNEAYQTAVAFSSTTSVDEYLDGVLRAYMYPLNAPDCMKPYGPNDLDGLACGIVSHCAIADGSFIGTDIENAIRNNSKRGLKMVSL